jgi:hypothetical protein
MIEGVHLIIFILFLAVLHLAAELFCHFLPILHELLLNSFFLDFLVDLVGFFNRNEQFGKVGQN